MRTTMIAALAVGTAATIGCGGGQEPQLSAEPRTSTLQVNGAEVGSQAGVQIRVAPVMQTSRYSNEADYRPVHVEIRNESDHPLRIGYDNFSLQGGGAASAEAVPVLWIDDSGRDIAGIGGAATPGWGHRNFEVAGDYAEMYPALRAYEGDFQSTTVDAYRARRPSGVEPGVLRDSMLLLASIPEGVVRPGGRVEGMLWFEAVEGADSTLTFTADLVNAQTGMEFGRITVPIALTRSGIQRGTETWMERDPSAAEPVEVSAIILAPDPATYNARRVQLNNVRVQKRVNDRVFWVGPDGGQWLLVTHGDPTAVGPISGTAIQEGQTVTLMGTLREPPTASEARASWRLDQAGAEMLGRSRLYLVADDVKTSTY